MAVNKSLSEALIVNLSTSDASALKLRSGLAKNDSDVFISIEYGSLADEAHNYFNAISATDARRVDTFIPDTVRPLLLSFDIDLVTTLVQPYNVL